VFSAWEGLVKNRLIHAGDSLQWTCLIAADDHSIWMEKVANGASFSEELGVVNKRNSGCIAVAPTGLFDDRPDAKSTPDGDCALGDDDSRLLEHPSDRSPRCLDGAHIG
jgi:hypothetical protein